MRAWSGLRAGVCANSKCPEFFVVDVSKSSLAERGNGSAGRTSKIDMSNISLACLCCWHGWCGELGCRIVESNGKLTIRSSATA